MKTAILWVPIDLGIAGFFGVQAARADVYWVSCLAGAMSGVYVGLAVLWLVGYLPHAVRSAPHGS